MSKFNAPRYSKAERLVEDWRDRINVVEDFDPGLSYEKKIVLAQCLENTQNVIDMMESTDTGDTSGFKSFAFSME